MVFPSIANAVAAIDAIPTQVGTGTVTGSAIDISNYSGTLLAILKSAAASTGDTLDLTVEESYDGSTNWAAVPADALVTPSTGAAATFTQVTDAATAGIKHQVLALKKDRLKQYIRFVCTLGGGSISFAFGVELIAPVVYSA